jgi:hypothetical protein
MGGRLWFFTSSHKFIKNNLGSAAKTPEKCHAAAKSGFRLSISVSVVVFVLALGECSPFSFRAVASSATWSLRYPKKKKTVYVRLSAKSTIPDCTPCNALTANFLVCHMHRPNPLERLKPRGVESWLVPHTKTLINRAVWELRIRSRPSAYPLQS